MWMQQINNETSISSWQQYTLTNTNKIQMTRRNVFENLDINSTPMLLLMKLTLLPILCIDGQHLLSAYCVPDTPLSLILSITFLFAALLWSIFISSFYRWGNWVSAKRSTVSSVSTVWVRARIQTQLSDFRPVHFAASYGFFWNKFNYFQVYSVLISILYFENQEFQLWLSRNEPDCYPWGCRFDLWSLTAG